MLKSVEGLGDRSAYGLPDESGVIIIAVGKGLLHQSNLQTKDVVVMANGKKIKTSRISWIFLTLLKILIKPYRSPLYVTNSN
ncbi:hypothetical protein KRR40_08460 [Niabella defluvii]|nr:hypothetical protein KRR40_08460 [Niabella sp. I65]